LHALTTLGAAEYLTGDESGREKIERTIALSRKAGLDHPFVRGSST
jgi:hypothetical protein